MVLLFATAQERAGFSRLSSCREGRGSDTSGTNKHGAPSARLLVLASTTTIATTPFLATILRDSVVHGSNVVSETLVHGIPRCFVGTREILRFVFRYLFAVRSVPNHRHRP